MPLLLSTNACSTPSSAKCTSSDKDGKIKIRTRKAKGKRKRKRKRKRKGKKEREKKKATFINVLLHVLIEGQWGIGICAAVQKIEFAIDVGTHQLAIEVGNLEGLPERHIKSVLQEVVSQHVSRYGAA